MKNNQISMVRESDNHVFYPSRLNKKSFVSMMMQHKKKVKYADYINLPIYFASYLSLRSEGN